MPLSRFGREHVMMDYYLEFIFPEKNIRYIAVAENEDTEKGLSDFVPFKNLFNEWFAKDTSRKVKAALRAKHAAGQRSCTYAPLGYKKDPDITEINFEKSCAGGPPQRPHSCFKAPVGEGLDPPARTPLRVWKYVIRYAHDREGQDPPLQYNHNFGEN